MGKNQKRRNSQKTSRRARRKSYVQSSQPKDDSITLTKPRREEQIRQCRLYAGRLVAYSVVIIVFFIGIGFIPYSYRPSDNTPFSREIYKLLLYLLFPLKLLIVWPILWIALVKKLVRKMIIWSRVLFVMNFLTSSLYFYLVSYGLGIFDRGYNFFLKTSPEQVEQQLPVWMRVFLTSLSSSILGAIILFLLKNAIYDGFKWLCSKTLKLLAKVINYLRAKFRAPQLTTSKEQEWQ
jgi:hypothetical protein